MRGKCENILGEDVRAFLVLNWQTFSVFQIISKSNIFKIKKIYILKIIKHGLWNQVVWNSSLARQLSSCVALGECSPLSEPPCFHPDKEPYHRPWCYSKSQTRAGKDL